MSSIEMAARAIWIQRQARFVEVGAKPLLSWRDQPEVTKEAVRLEAAAALRSVGHVER